MSIEVRESVDNGLRLVRRRSVVEPDELSAIDPLRENRKVASNSVDVKRGTCRRGGIGYAMR